MIWNMQLSLKNGQCENKESPHHRHLLAEALTQGSHSLVDATLTKGCRSLFFLPNCPTAMHIPVLQFTRLANLKTSFQNLVVFPLHPILHVSLNTLILPDICIT